MGQQESKQKLEQITQSLHKIRKDLRNGKITANEVERFQTILQRYTTEIQGATNVRSKNIYTVEQLIEITSKELDALKQEVNLDLVAVPTNSFSRASSKNYSKEKRKSTKSITDAVQDIRQQLRLGKIPQQDYERYQRDLANYSQLLAKKSKKTETEAAQKLISSVTQDFFIKQQEIQETGSLRSATASQKQDRRSSMTEKRISTSEKKSSLKQEPKKEIPNIANKNVKSTLDDIENKLQTLKSDIKVAEANKDKSRLHFLSKSIQTLMTDVQMVNIGNQILKEERKELLEMNLQAAFKEIDKIKRQLTQENDLEYLTELHNKEVRNKTLQYLEDTEKSLLTLTASLNHQNFQSAKETFLKYQKQLDYIEATDEEVTTRKADVSKILSNVEKVITRLEMEERLNQAEWRHFQYKIDLKQFNEISTSDSYKKHRQYLTQLKDYVNKVLEINDKIGEKKKYILYNIDNNIVALDQRAKDNEDKLNKNTDLQTNKQKGEPMRKSSETPKDLANKLLITCKDMTSYSSQDLQNMLQILNAARVIIQEKLTQLDNQNREDMSDVQLVTVKEKQLEPITNSLYPVESQIAQIEEEVEALQTSIDNSHYTKEEQMYKDTKNKLDNFKNQITNLSKGQENGSSSKIVLRHIDNVQVQLESKAANRKSTTEDILVDIMSVSTRVKELGSKIQNYRYNPQDYDFIKNSLIENRRYLRSLHIASSRTNLLKSRDDIIQEIEHYLATLEHVSNTENSSGSQELQQFNQEVRKIKEKVARYSGTYKNVLYKAIESDVDKHLNKVDKIFKDSNAAAKVKQDLQNTKMILEQKSTKDPHYNSMERNLQDQRITELNEIKRNVDSVTGELNQSDPLSQEDLDKLDARLTLSVLALDNIKDDYAMEEKEKLRQDIDLNFQTIHQLKVVSTKPPERVSSPHQKHVDEKQVMLNTIASIQRDLEEVKPQILSFVGAETSPGFLHLDEVLVRGTLKLDSINVDQISELYQIKVKLMREMHELSDILDDRVSQTEEIEKLEKEVNVMLMKIDSFNGYFGDSEYTYLDEEIIKLKVNLGKLNVCPELIPRKEECMREVNACMKKLNEVAKSVSGSITGTLV